MPSAYANPVKHFVAFWRKTDIIASVRNKSAPDPTREVKLADVRVRFTLKADIRRAAELSVQCHIRTLRSLPTFAGRLGFPQTTFR